MPPLIFGKAKEGRDGNAIGLVFEICPGVRLVLGVVFVGGLTPFHPEAIGLLAGAGRVESHTGLEPEVSIIEWDDGES